MAFLVYHAPTLLCGSLVIAAVLIPLIVAANLVRRLCSDARIPANLPWAGVGPNGGCLSRARANLASVFGLKKLLDEGYTEYSKKGQAYVLPHILTGPEVVLPLSQARWLVEQPDSVMSQTEVNRQFLEADHTFLHPNIVREPVHPQVIQRELTHRLDSFADDILDELKESLVDNWGTDTENWKEVHIYETMLDTISRLSTRVFVGKPLCRNKEFLKSARTFDRNVVVSAAGLNLLPGFLKPIFGPILTIYDYVQYRTLAKFVMPSIRERLAALNEKEKLPLYDDKKPNDYIQWAIDHAQAHWDPLELTDTVIARRLACLCFAAIQSSVISLTNTIFDIASSPHCAEWLDAMREQVVVGQQESSWGRKASLARLTRVDSALRESMRLNGFVARGIMKTVVAPGGVVLPDGTRLPRGTKVGIQAYSVHRDGDIYDEAELYNAFRFVPAAPPTASSSSGRSSPSSSVSGGESSDEGSRRRRVKGKQQPQALVTTSPTFLAFSHGPNACPGRFFAANQLKLTLAMIAKDYEIEPIPDRPDNKWFVGSMAPPMWHTLRVRRRAS